MHIESGSRSMTIFSSYEDDYLACARNINAHINEGSDAASALEEAENLLRGMEIEVHICSRMCFYVGHNSSRDCCQLTATDAHFSFCPSVDFGTRILPGPSEPQHERSREEALSEQETAVQE